MIRKKAIEDAVAKVVDLRSRATKLESESEQRYGFTLKRIEAECYILNHKADRVADEIIEKLIKHGLCKESTGLTADEAMHPIFDGIEHLWEIGDGWC